MAAVGSLLVTLLHSAPLVAGDQGQALTNEVANLRYKVELVSSTLETVREKERQFPLERRYVEANIAYERGNLPTASVLLFDLVSDPRFQTSRDFSDALHMLADSLYRQRNYAGAKRYYDRLLEQPASKWFQSALAQTVDIAVRLRRMDEVAALTKKLDLVPPGDRKGELFYQFGRSYFLAKDFARARSFLDQVGAEDARWGAARFYVGAALVAQNKGEQAAAEFRKIADAAKATAADSKRKIDATVLDYTHLALGRLLLQQKKYDDAAQFYGAIERNSPVFEEALFELAATYVAANQPKRALEALDILLLTVSDDNVAVQAAVLRGRINMLDKQYDKADAAYKEVVERYSMIEGELRNFASSDKNLEQFFTWLLSRGSDEYTVVRPVSERVSKYIERDEDMQRVVGLFDDMSAARADVKESAKIANLLDAALRDSSRLDRFPELKDAWVQLTTYQNSCVDVSKRIVDALKALAASRLGTEDKARAAELADQRQELEAEFAKIPSDPKAYLKRQSRVNNDFTNLAGEVGLLKAQLAGVKDQLLNVEKILNEQVFGGEGVTLSKEAEAKIRQSLTNEKDELRRVYRELEDLLQHVEVSAQSVGAGDKVSADEAQIRARLLQVYRAEQEFYTSVLERSGADVDAVNLANTRRAVDKLMGDITGLFGTIRRRASDQLDGIKKVLQQEQRNIADYQGSVRSYEDDSRTLARQVGNTLVRAAQNRLSEIILEADLGMVDVAWQMQQEKTKAIRELQDERKQRMDSLETLLNNLTSSGGEEEP